jgi:hypothetical protein
MGPNDTTQGQATFKRQCLLRDRLLTPDVNRIERHPVGQARWAKLAVPRGKLAAVACHLTKKVNKAE